MGNTLTVRLPGDLAEWLATTAAKAGVPKSSIVRQQIENARAVQEKPFMRLAGVVAGPVDLSARKGFSRK
jgi:predicted transcriptional regulator